MGASTQRARRQASLRRKNEISGFIEPHGALHHDKHMAMLMKINADLNWMPDEDFESGILKTVVWYLENKDWWQRVVDGSYQLERIGTAS